jgi:putative Ca2+/H+ antiporter (TMEM165/GDT1 family)
VVNAFLGDSGLTHIMEAFLISTSIVALAEMGDKTQLLSLVLAAKYRKPLPIVAGIFAATVVNHALAGAVGNWITTVLGPDPLSYYWVVAGTTLGMMLANAPVVWFGDKITKRLPIKTIHRVCAVIFLVLGIAALVTKV